MTPWFLAASLYGTGLYGLYHSNLDPERPKPQDWVDGLMLVAWPLTVGLAFCLNLRDDWLRRYGRD